MQSPERSTNPGQFDYALYLAKQNITAEMTIASLDDCICSGSSSLSKIDSLRENMQRTLIETYEHITYAWMNGLIFGDDSLISEENIELFRRWNLSHLLAISGLHVGLIITILYFFACKDRNCNKRKSTIIDYVILTNLCANCWRRTICTKSKCDGITCYDILKNEDKNGNYRCY